MEGSRIGTGRCIVGTAGWPLPSAAREAFGPGANLLERYATRMAAVEINTSFYRPHQPATYARWAAAVPMDFRFSVKLPRTITHERRLVGAEAELDAFLMQVGHLGDKLGCLLVQLPPSLALNECQAGNFFSALRQRHGGEVLLEPRHRSWFGEAARALLVRHGLGLVRADPLPCAEAAWPMAPADASPGTTYYRLHGSPCMYYSAYDEHFLQALAQRMLKGGRQADTVWCIFDNTAEGAATANALALQAMLEQQAHGQGLQNRK